MKWFRSNIKHGSRLALLALAIQFVLSFGHHHGAAALAAPAPVQASDAGAAAQSLAGKQPSAQHAAVGDSEASATNPAKPASGHDQDSDYCAVCAVMALASTVLFTEPPVLLLPDAYHFLYLATEAEFDHLESRRNLSQPRAPPAS